MRYVDIERAEFYSGASGATGPIIYVIDLPEHPFDIAGVAMGRAAHIVRVPVRSWDDSLTPWPAPGLRRGDADFKGEAAVTLAELKAEAAPALEARWGLEPVRRAICGYSLGGLFSLYAFVQDAYFDACGCLSGSLWYEGWTDYLRDRAFDGAGRYAYLSIGKKECKASLPILRTVQANMEACAELLRDRGCAVDYRVGPGNHMQHHVERFDAGLTAIDAHLDR